jgi:hypothetical protein
MRSHLLRIITRWEQSGQGENVRDNDVDAEEEDAKEASSTISTDNDFHDRMIGSLSGRPACALQSRAAFPNGRPSYLLYIWAIADSDQLLQSSLQRLSNSTGASDALLAPSTSNSSRTRLRQEGQHDESRHYNRDKEATLLHPLVESIKEFVECQQQLQFNSHNSSNEDHRHSFEVVEIHHPVVHCT